MARGRRARRISRLEPGHGVVVRRGARPSPAKIAASSGSRSCRSPWGMRYRLRPLRSSFCGWAGLWTDGAVRVGAALLLIGWALYHWRFGHRHRVRFGMQVGLAGLFVWSFLMAAAHGAGLMLWPALMPLCLPSDAGAVPASAPLVAGLAGVGVHTLAMLSVTAAIAAHGLRVGRTRGSAQGLAEH